MSEDLQIQLQEILGENYRIERELGGAGMSRVFVATDLSLDRQIVVKVLPPELAAGVNVDRFRREIQMAARLQHPHVVPLLSAGAKGALLYYTMPFIIGENLRTRLTRTRELPVAEAIRILRQVADALGYAHSQGIVHRDIKPENILISGNHALVADFGVSKALASATSETKTEGPNLTSLGIALGTPAYMAPEQAAADPMVDHRADIYALGVVAYELLAGRTPFTGLTPQQVLAAHITTQPDGLERHRPQVPPGLALVIMRCLEKNPADRWQTAEELRDQLEANSVASGATNPVAALKPRFRWTPQRIAVAAGAAGLLVAAAIGSSFAFRSSGVGYVVGTARQVTTAQGVELYPEISPDGKLVAYSTGNPAPRLFVRQIEGGRAIALTDSVTRGSLPRWTADGGTIVFMGVDGSHSVPSLGGTAQRLPGTDSLVACVPSHRGRRFACVQRENGALVVLNAEDDTKITLDSLGTVEGLLMPAWSHDDSKIAYVQGNFQFTYPGPFLGNIARSVIRVVPADGGKSVIVTNESHLNTSPAWTPEGSLLYVSNRGGPRDIYLQRISGSGAPRGEPQRLTTGLSAHTISLSRDGRALAYSTLSTIANVFAIPIPSAPTSDEFRMRAITTGNQTVESFGLSPDGGWLAFDSNLSGNQEIYTVPISGGEPKRLTHSTGDSFFPSWSPDGRQIVFHTIRGGSRDVYIVPSQGGKEVPLVASPSQERGPTWATNGKRVIYSVDLKAIWAVDLENSDGAWSKPRPFINARGYARYSPDGKHIAVSSSVGKGLHITDADGAPVRVISTAGLQPLGITWSRDSRLIYFFSMGADEKLAIYSVPISGGSPTQVIHFTDPARSPYRTEFAVDAENFYLVMGTREADIWVMDLQRQ